MAKDKLLDVEIEMISEARLEALWRWGRRPRLVAGKGTAAKEPPCETCGGLVKHRKAICLTPRKEST
jgi:hypothetical protein